jgi:hypothetical protein
MEEVHKYHMDEQDKMEELIKLSALRKITLYSEEKLQTNTDAAYNFWLQQDTSVIVLIPALLLQLL